MTPTTRIGIQRLVCMVALLLTVTFPPASGVPWELNAVPESIIEVDVRDFVLAGKWITLP